MPKPKDIFEVKIDFKDIAIDINEVGRTLGYPDGEMPDHFRQMVESVIKQIPKRCVIQAGYRILDLKKPVDKNDGLIIGGVFFDTDKIVASQLKKGNKAAVFVCSIGPGMETWSKQMLIDGDPIMGYFIDTVASAITENAVNFLHDAIGLEMKKNGLNITNRYSPGYCNWSVAEQHLLFSLLPKNFCGVKLTESALMLPIKSVSGIIGIGEEVEWREYLCDKCGMKDCTYRSIRTRNSLKK